MKINTNSWHYRAINHLDWWHPKSLCPYFWKALFATLILLLFGCVGGFFAGCYVGFAAVFVTSIAIDGPSVFSFGQAGIESVVVPIGAALWAGTLWICGFAAWVPFRDSEYMNSNKVSKWLRKRKKEEATPKQKSLFVAFLKASHDKVCPRLDFEEER
ncbi:MAG: hypothetical protein ACRBBW_13035 [Cellvibrionaceae bacterium]